MELALCELQCPELHGGNNPCHFLVHTTYTLNDWCGYKCTFIPRNASLESYDRQMRQLTNEIMKTEVWLKKVTVIVSKRGINECIVHPVIRNYYSIIQHPSYMKLEIVKTFMLSTGELVAVLKTHYLRLFQRTWRRVHRDKMNRITKHSYLRNRELISDVCVWKRQSQHFACPSVC